MTPLDTRLVRSVSRSFYLSLKILPPAVRPVMALGYVLCRAADDIADTDLIPAENRLEALRKFLGAFDSFPIDGKRLEGVLPTSYEGCAKSFSSLPPTQQAFVQKVVVGVIQGMIMDLESFGDSPETLKAFRTKADLETYLGWIGGEPGRFWTNILLHEGLFPATAPRERLFDYGIAFGRGLQMVNILKDLPEDLARGRCYLPAESLKPYNITPSDLLTNEKLDRFLTLYHQLIKETVKRLENGLFYLNQMHRFDWRLKAAVWWPLAIGLKTLAQLRQSRTILSKDSKRRIKRADVYKTMAGSIVLLPSEKGLSSEFKRLVQPILY